MEFMPLSRRRSSARNTPAAKSKEKRMFSQAIWQQHAKKYSEFYEKIPTYPSEVLLRKMLGRGEVALGLGAESCAAACIPADGGTLKIGTL